MRLALSDKRLARHFPSYCIKMNAWTCAELPTSPTQLNFTSRLQYTFVGNVYVCVCDTEGVGGPF